MLGGLFVPVPSAMATGEGEADACRVGEFLGLKQWHAGLCKNGELVPVCEKEGGCGDPANEVSLQYFIWRVVLNIMFDAMLLIGYIAAAMVIYGGYMFIMSQGDPSRAAKGKKTLASAIIGLVISIGASVIVNTVIKILGIDRDGGWNQGGFDKDAMAGIFNWAYLAAGIVAVAFLIKSGVDYMISAGDLGKTKKATHSIIYSVVGLILVILASVITNFVISAIGEAM